MNVTRPDSETFIEKRSKEERICSLCHYLIQNPLTDRCPRCFSFVERADVPCGECTFQGNCDIVRLRSSNQ